MMLIVDSCLKAIWFIRKWSVVHYYQTKIIISPFLRQGGVMKGATQVYSLSN